MTTIEKRISAFFKTWGFKSPVIGAVFWLIMQYFAIALINYLSSQLSNPINVIVEVLLLPVAYIALFLFIWRLSDLVRDENKLHLIRRIIILLFLLMSIGLAFNILITFVTL